MVQLIKGCLLATKTDDLSSITGPQTVEGENGLLQVVF